MARQFFGASKHAQFIGLQGFAQRHFGGLEIIAALAATPYPCQLPIAARRHGFSTFEMGWRETLQAAARRLDGSLLPAIAIARQIGRTEIDADARSQ